jgi:hypothetical protein
LRWSWQWSRRRECGESAAVENPDADKTVRVPSFGKMQLIKELDILGKCM